MRKVYKLRQDVEITLDNRRQKEVAEVLGITEKHLSQVLNRKVNCSRMLAIHLSIINKQGNFDYLFEEVKGE